MPFARVLMARRPATVNGGRCVLTRPPSSRRRSSRMAQNVALVTGASSGIGEALARRLARDGRSLVLVARRADRLESLAEALRAEHGVEAHVLAQDLLQAGAVQAVLAEVERRGLTVEWVVNNAGFGTGGRFDQRPVGHELEEVRLNVEALVEFTGRCLPGMVARRRGSVMNIASMAAFGPMAYSATYGATKAFVLSFSEAIAAELRGTGVQVLCVCPGFTRTEFQEKAHIDASAVPGFFWMSAEEVADQAVGALGRDTVLLQAGRDGKTDWYRNLQQNPSVTLHCGSYTFRGRAAVLTDPKRVDEVHRLFLKKYTSAWLLSFVGSSIGRGRPVEVIPWSVA